MSKFSDFANKAQDPTPEEEWVIIEGAFSCQVCFEQVDEAKWNPRNRWLDWKCSEGHMSYVEDFS